jgi:mannose-P-dolichol utilization defect protein 1
MDSALAHLEPLVALVRPHLLPLITALPAPIHAFGLSQLGPECYQTIVGRLDLSSPTCTQLAISKAIGVGIVGLSTIVKVPQLLKLVQSRSAKGISFTSYLLETSAYIITLAYNVRSGNPFSTYGEIAILALQNVVISVLVLHYRGKAPVAAAYAMVLAAAWYALFNEAVVNKDMMVLVQTATIPLGLMSKIPQIWTIAKEKSTGQLSAFAVSSPSLRDPPCRLLMLRIGL